MKSEMQKQLAVRLLSVWARKDILIRQKNQMLEITATLLERSDINLSVIGMSAGRSRDIADTVAWSVIRRDNLEENARIIREEINGMYKAERFIEKVIAEEFGDSRGLPRRALLSRYRDNVSWVKIASSNGIHVGEVRLMHARIIDGIMRRVKVE